MDALLWWWCYFICACVVCVCSLFCMAMPWPVCLMHGSVLACVMRIAVVCLCCAEFQCSVRAINGKHKSKVLIISLPPPSPCHPCWPGLPCILCSGRGRDHARHSPVIMVVRGAVQHPCLLQEQRTTLRVVLQGGAPVAAWPPALARLSWWGWRLISAEEGQGREIGCHLELGVTMVIVPMSNGHHGDRS